MILRMKRRAPWQRMIKMNTELKRIHFTFKTNQLSRHQSQMFIPKKLQCWKHSYNVQIITKLSFWPRPTSGIPHGCNLSCYKRPRLQQRISPWLHIISGWSAVVVSCRSGTIYMSESARKLLAHGWRHEFRNRTQHLVVNTGNKKCCQSHQL